MPVRRSTATWNGSLSEGSGSIELGSGAWSGAYSVPSRFAAGAGSNPEELIAAAHAGCYSMAFSKALGDAGFAPESIHTSASVRINAKPEGGFLIDRIELVCEARVPGIAEAQFQQLAAATKEGCPVSGALAAVPQITLTASLKGA